MYESATVIQACDARGANDFPRDNGAKLLFVNTPEGGVFAQ